MNLTRPKPTRKGGPQLWKEVKWARHPRVLIPNNVSETSVIVRIILVDLELSLIDRQSTFRNNQLKKNAVRLVARPGLRLHLQLKRQNRACCSRVSTPRRSQSLQRCCCAQRCRSLQRCKGRLGRCHHRCCNLLQSQVEFHVGWPRSKAYHSR